MKENFRFLFFFGSFLLLNHNIKFHSEHHLISSLSKILRQRLRKFLLLLLGSASNYSQDNNEGARETFFPPTDTEKLFLLKLKIKSLQSFESFTSHTELKKASSLIKMCRWLRAFPSYTSVRVLSNHWNRIFTIEKMLFIVFLRRVPFLLPSDARWFLVVLNRHERKREMRGKWAQCSENCILNEEEKDFGKISK